MIGTLSLVAAFALGFLHFPIWWIVPLAILNNFIGMHTPPERMTAIKEMGVGNWRFFVTNLPLIALFTVLVYGLGYVIGYLWSVAF